MKGGWGDGLSTRLCRLMPVRNLALGATNSLTALIRLQSDVALRPGDVVVWANAINDAICLSNSDQSPRRMIEYVETMIRMCQAAGARFVPVLLDTFPRHLMIQQSTYARYIDHVTKHYELDVVNLPTSFAAKSGTTAIPRRYFLDVLHLVPGGELCEFVAELTMDLIRQERGVPVDRAPIFCPKELRFEVVSDFEPTGRREMFHNHLLDKVVWNPPISLSPKVPAEGHCEIEAVTVIADFQSGRFAMRTGDQSLALSANHNFTQTGSPIALTTCLRVIAPGGVVLTPGQSIDFEWSPGAEPIPVDMYFRAVPVSPLTPASRARVLSVLLRHQDNPPDVQSPLTLGRRGFVM